MTIHPSDSRIVPERREQHDAADEETWLGMLRDRNMTSHLYHEGLASEIADRVMNLYVPLLDNAYHDLG